MHVGAHFFALSPALHRELLKPRFFFPASVFSSVLRWHVARGQLEPPFAFSQGHLRAALGIPSLDPANNPPRPPKGLAPWAICFPSLLRALCSLCPFYPSLLSATTCCTPSLSFPRLIWSWISIPHFFFGQALCGVLRFFFFFLCFSPL